LEEIINFLQLASQKDHENSKLCAEFSWYNIIILGLFIDAGAYTKPIT